MPSDSRAIPLWTEGVCGDGAAILCDGVPVSISDLLAVLNAREVEVERLQRALTKIANGAEPARTIGQVALATRRLCDADFVDAYYCRGAPCRRTGLCAGIRETLQHVG